MTGHKKQHLRPGFTLIETVFSLLVVLLTCMVMLMDLRLAKSLLPRLQDTATENAQTAFIQLADYLADKRVKRTNDAKTEVILTNAEDTSYLLKFKSTQQQIVVSNAAGSGYMPLWFKVWHAKFDYQAPLLKVQLQLANQDKLNRYFLVESVKEGADESKDQTANKELDDLRKQR